MSKATGPFELPMAFTVLALRLHCLRSYPNRALVVPKQIVHLTYCEECRTLRRLPHRDQQRRRLTARFDVIDSSRKGRRTDLRLFPALKKSVGKGSAAQ